MFICESDQVPSRIDCDICCEADAEAEQGYAFVARGATGRWCEVMWLCDGCGDKQDDEPYTAEAARDMIFHDATGEWADF